MATYRSIAALERIGNTLFHLSERGLSAGNQQAASADVDSTNSSGDELLPGSTSRRQHDESRPNPLDLTVTRHAFERGDSEEEIELVPTSNSDRVSYNV